MQPVAAVTLGDCPVWRPGNVGRVVTTEYPSPREGAPSVADKNVVPEADALEQALPPRDADPELLDVEDDPEIGVDVPEADAMEQSRPRAVPASVAAKPIPFDAPENDVLEQRLPAAHEDDDDDFR